MPCDELVSSPMFPLLGSFVTRWARKWCPAIPVFIVGLANRIQLNHAVSLISAPTCYSVQPAEAVLKRVRQRLESLEQQYEQIRIDGQ